MKVLNEVLRKNVIVFYEIYLIAIAYWNVEEVQILSIILYYHCYVITRYKKTHIVFKLYFQITNGM